MKGGYNPSRRCRRCGQPLTNPGSQLIGMGKTCARKAEEEKKIPLEESVILQLTGMRSPGDYGLDIHCFIIKGKPWISVKYKIKHYNPGGLYWGDEGEGSAELALNILVLFVPPAEAIKLHIDFMKRFVTPLPGDGGIIKNSEVKNWLAKQRSRSDSITAQG